MVFAGKGQEPLEGCYYLDSLGGVGEADDVDTVVCDSGLQDLCTVPESEQVPTGHAGDFWHKIGIY